MGEKAEAEFAAATAARHGVFCRNEWLGADLSVSTLKRRVSVGRLQRVAPEIYMFARVPVTWHTEVMTAVLGAGGRAAASHRTAAFLHGLSTRPTSIEIVGLRNTRRPPGYVVHQSTDLPRAHITTVEGIPTTTVARTIVDIGVPHGIGSTASCLDEARRKNMVTLEEVAALLHQVARRGRNGVGPARRIITERLGWDQITDSQLEDRFLRLLQRFQLPQPEAQWVVNDPAGFFVARVDFAYPEIGLLIELDGAAYHTDRKTFQRDRQRQNRLITLGFRVLRFTYWDVLAGGDFVVDTVAGLLPGNWGPGDHI